ncbi:MAG TPA: hypothetical protein VMW43_11025 [Bacteroidota bacterium]|nr:hypothetical protein [Bacteroidota bacterium]
MPTPALIVRKFPRGIVCRPSITFDHHKNMISQIGGSLVWRTFAATRMT